MRSLAFVTVGALALAVSTPSFASVSMVSSAAALGANDSIDWGQTNGATPFAVVSGGGVVANVTTSGSGLYRIDQDGGWAGNFTPGDRLVWTVYSGPDITINFATPVFGAGAQIQSNFFGEFIARVTASDGVNSYSFASPGDSNGSSDGSAIFIGVLSSTQTLTSLTFTLDSAASNPNDFAINAVQLNTAVVPEPASWALMIVGFGLVGVSVRRRKAAIAA
jgi:hypothetical protein